MAKDTIIITGVTGMDGSLMSDYILEKTDHFNVIGVVRHLSSNNWKNIEKILDHPNFKLEEADLNDGISMTNLIKKYKPKHFFNFAAMSFVGNSWDQPILHMQTNLLSLVYILEAIRKYSPRTRFYQAGSSESFGDVKYSPQDENHPLSPRSVYGVSKASAHLLVKVYRESYGLYAISGFLFNHESISGRRGDMFVTRKITKNVARILSEIEEGIEPEPLRLGNIYSKRDWSASEDFMDGIWRMMNQDFYNEDLRHDIFTTVFDSDEDLNRHLSSKIKYYVLASGETHTVKEFVEKSFGYAGIKGRWEGEGLNEKFIYDYPDGEDVLMEVDEKFYRPLEVDLLLGDPTLAKKELGWRPLVSFDQLVQKMTEHDIKNICS